ncbi:glycerophosphodiester phosphodiesterase [Hahella aquimaris]|uniref:glycerophosphodiester phosphodiesterase n=1 Tax=Hahella sp. HNIBRBA332 TaxID=3015983 RepID=UPI00273BD432|nr:glycerophosphodiester phosphodiesterase [Hahella sp. HNIBRBA332]WLQ16886.1 glycerophosphodiester phosphodiesterase [Hahella sp. HNIBRBA332]
MIIVGHRGAKGEAPENTVAGFVHPYREGIRNFELDLQLSKDGHLMVIHDKTTNRTTGHAAKVAELTAAELGDLDAGLHIPPWHEPAAVPTLQDILAACPEFQSIQLEIKTDTKPRLNILCNRLVELIQHEKLFGRVIVTSSNSWVLQQIKRLNGSIDTGYVAEKRFPGPIQTALKLNCRMLVLYYKLADEELMREARKAGLEVSTWTVNMIPDVLRLQELGVHSVITDYPCHVLKYLKTQQPHLTHAQ